LDKFIPLKNGKPSFSKTKTPKGYQIKFYNNGLYGYTIFRGKTALEDRIWSLKRAEEIIEEMGA